jgi:AcrR family transcriptional regulator
MSRSPAPHGRTGRPPLTSRAQILTAARTLIDRDGWEKLTIRRLAAELGIAAATLYHHIRDKEDLLVLLLNGYVEQIDRPALPDDPQERIVAAGLAMRSALAAWPWAAEVLTADGFVLRLDESALWIVETILAAADDCGCSPEQGVDVFRNIWYYTVGEILVRTHTAQRRSEDEVRAPRDTFDADQVPHLAAVGDRWQALAARDSYPEGLRALVDGMLALAVPDRSRGVG